MRGYPRLYGRIADITEGPAFATNSLPHSLPGLGRITRQIVKQLLRVGTGLPGGLRP